MRASTRVSQSGHSGCNQSNNVTLSCATRQYILDLDDAPLCSGLLRNDKYTLCNLFAALGENFHKWEFFLIRKYPVGHPYGHVCTKVRRVSHRFPSLSLSFAMQDRDIVLFFRPHRRICATSLSTALASSSWALWSSASGIWSSAATVRWAVPS